MKLVAQVNSGLVLATWPFIIYETFNKGAPINSIKSNLDVCRGQLLNLVTERIEEVLQPFWPKTSSLILVDPEYRVETTSVFSDAAADAVRDCLENAETLLRRAARIRRLPQIILRLDRITHWLVYITGAQSLAWLVVWFFASSSMSDLVARFGIFSPAITASAAFLFAGVRQAYHHKAQMEITREPTNS